MFITKSQAAFYDAYYSQLNGAKIKKVWLEEDDSLYLVHITVVTSDNKELDLELCSDAEGNSTGFLFGLPYPVIKDKHAFD